MMLAELSTLFAHSDVNATHEELRSLVLDENILLKSTAANRREVLTRLGVMYGLRREIAVYRVLRYLWEQAEKDRPLLALLVALGRDSLLRATAPIVLEAPAGAEVTSVSMQPMLEEAFPGQYSAIGKGSVTRHAASSWTQSGHLIGRNPKSRALVQPGPSAVTMALWLGDLCGYRGLPLYETFWIQTLDLSPSSVDALAIDAHRRGWIDYRRLGDVLQISFGPLNRATGSE